MLTINDIDAFCDAHNEACRLHGKIVGYRWEDNVCLAPMSKFLEVNKLCNVPIQRETLSTLPSLFFVYKGVKFFRVELDEKGDI